MKKYKIIFILFIIILSCKKNPRPLDNNKKVESKQEVVINNQKLSKELNKYISKYSINNKEYFFILSFYRERDTLVSISRSLYFPEIIEENQVEFKGVFIRNNVPIIIIDKKISLGEKWYNFKKLKRQIDNKYKMKQEEKESNILPPFWIYKIMNKKLILIRKTDSINLL